MTDWATDWVRNWLSESQSVQVTDWVTELVTYPSKEDVGNDTSLKHPEEGLGCEGREQERKDAEEYSGVEDGHQVAPAVVDDEYCDGPRL